ncbi:hypothetical protein L596_025034 [Steinernema carpocapsae]|uniref:Chromo shadow domain-containing protein n=1 Tax=Steinernema carpocapsae TaxID=34508 RepID=A0A4U5M6M0_STECR|nr:hypothetical protein L596_025034 [Steinernema carpocapsae]
MHTTNTEKRSGEMFINSQHGLRDGFTPKKILAATKQMGETLFLVEYFDTDELDLAPKQEVFDRAPLIVLQFFEKYIPASVNPA